MGLIAWVRKILDGRVTDVKDTEAFVSAAAEVCVRELAFQSAVNLIANAVSRCEFRTLDRGERMKGPEYYLWNVRPNPNQNKSAFIHKLIDQLYRHNEALVIEAGEGVFVADSFQVEEFALRDWKFTGVTVDNLTFNKTFYMQDVLYFRLNNRDINKVLGLLYNSYGKLLTCGMKAYQRGRGVRGLLRISSQAQKSKDFEATFQRITGTDLKQFMSADYAVLPQYDGYQYEELGTKTYAAENSRDLRSMVDDIFDFTARALCIPPTMLKGDIADTSVAVDNLLTFAVDPLVELLASEINGKRNGREDYLAGTRTEICTHSIRHVDLLNAAAGMEKLISSGAFSVNQVLDLLGEPRINEPWADRHFITKNYASIEEFLTDLKGGEKQ